MSSFTQYLERKGAGPLDGERLCPQRRPAHRMAPG